VTRLLIVADIRLYRVGLARVLADESGIDAFATAGSAAEAVDAMREDPADVVLLDMSVPGSGQLVRRLNTYARPTPVVALGGLDDERHVIAYAEAGVTGYVPRDGSLSDLVQAIHSAARGEMVCSPRIAGSLMRHVGVLAARSQPDEPKPNLTSRELEIVGLIDEGLSNKQIARRLSIELPTVKNHVHHILEKLHVNRRGDAAARLRRWQREPDPASVRD
jgi:two-component system nitrate/nitrite response regulator NarL